MADDTQAGESPGAGRGTAAQDGLAAGSGPAPAGGLASGSGPAPAGGLASGSGPAPAGGFATGSGLGADGQPGKKNRWKATDDGRTVFRRGTPFVLWWIWVVFVIFNLAQVIIPDHDYFSLELGAGLLALTGVAYATALRPRVVASDDGIVVHNPVRDHFIRWGAVTGVYLGDSVELSCARPAPGKDKTIHCWALYSNRRSRMKQQQIGVRSWLRNSPGSSRAPAEVRDLASQDSAQLMAAELGSRATSAREAGAPPATLQSRWVWQPIAAMLVPAAALLALVLAK
jgi:Bacterial PH domain